MVQFYETYSTVSFKSLVEHYGMQHYLADAFHNPVSENVPNEMAQLPESEFVPNGLAQIPSVLLATGWSNHQLIMSKCKSDEQRLFYMLYAGHEQLEYDELKRAFATDAMSSVLGSKDVQSEVMKSQYPQAGILFKDTIYLEMFGLPVRYKESKLRKKIVDHMRDFILEMGKDFLFIDDEHRVKVGGKTFKVDLLFYHRQLQCYGSH